MIQPSGVTLRAIRRLFAVVALAFVVACGGDQVGRICDLGTSIDDPNEVIVASPSLDCVSRTCLRVPEGKALPPGEVGTGSDSGLCTSECTADSDCDRVPESPCQTGFACSVQVTVGPFCCRKFCVCKDYIVIPASGDIPDPLACDPSNAANTCQNLPGRS